MINMGVPMTILLLLQTGTILVIRQMLLQVSGEVENGYFHVAWALAGTINSLLISSLDGDFLRRLSHAARDKSLAAVAVHHQVELVTRPLTVVVVLFVAFTNIAVVVLLSREFMPAILSIQVMVISELFRGLASVYGKTPFAYGHPWLAMLPDLISAIALIGSAYYLIPAAGAFGAAVAFLLSRLVLLGVSVLLSSQLLGKNPSSEELVLLGASGLAVLLVLAASSQSLIFGYLIGVAGLIYGVRVAYSLFAQR